MSDTMGTASSGVTHPIHHTDPGPAVREVVHEAYAFACMRCGRGWEQAYVIEHHVDADGKPFIVYLADGERVPSPLSRPTCAACGSHVVRIMRSGQLSPFAARGNQPPVGPLVPPQEATPDAAGGGAAPGATAERRAAGRHRWHLSDFFHPFRHPGRPEDADVASGAESGAVRPELPEEEAGPVAPDDGLRPPHRS
ncbi:hypothetical protein [Streptomyces sp. NPDC018031]|uniref:hypothetical protein n=1 Tax=Streptomyces sp. NPDC018031 TaxID=3365033 RepID=UPI0037A5EAC8